MMHYVSDRTCPDCGNTLQSIVVSDFHHWLDCVFCPWLGQLIQVALPATPDDEFRVSCDRRMAETLPAFKASVAAAMAEMGISR